MVVILAIPPGCLVFVLALNALPLTSAYAGLSHQTVWLFVRNFVANAFRTFTVTNQLHESSPTLPLSARQQFAICVVLPASTVLGFVVIGALWVFPTPLCPLIAQVPAIFVALVAFKWLWGDAFRRDALAKAKLFCFLRVIRVQISLFTVYTAYDIAFCAA